MRLPALWWHLVIAVDALRWWWSDRHERAVVTGRRSSARRVRLRWMRDAAWSRGWVLTWERETGRPPTMTRAEWVDRVVTDIVADSDAREGPRPDGADLVPWDDDYEEAA